MSERLSRAETEAIALLAKSHRLIVIVIPRGVPSESVRDIKRDVDARLDDLVRLRGPMA